MVTKLSESLAAVVQRYFAERTGRHTRERMDGMLADLTMDPGLQQMMRELADEFDKAIQAGLDTISDKLAPCSGRGSRCAAHGQPKGPDLQCDVGRGGPLAISRPAAQKRKPTKTPARGPRGKTATRKSR